MQTFNALAWPPQSPYLYPIEHVKQKLNKYPIPTKENASIVEVCASFCPFHHS